MALDRVGIRHCWPLQSGGADLFSDGVTVLSGRLHSHGYVLGCRGSLVLQQVSALPSSAALSASMAAALQRPCCLCPLPCRGDRAPFRLYPVGNKTGTYAHDSCIKAEKKRAAAEAALAQPDTDAGASSAAVASVVKKQKTDAADADAAVRGVATGSTGEYSCGETRSSMLQEDAAVPAAATSLSSNAAAAAHLLFALHTRYIWTALLCVLCCPCEMFLASHHSTLFSVAAICICLQLCSRCCCLTAPCRC